MAMDSPNATPTARSPAYTPSASNSSLSDDLVKALLLLEAGVDGATLSENADSKTSMAVVNNHQPAGGDEGNNFESLSATDAPPDVPTNTPNEVPTDAPTTGISCDGSLYLYYYFANKHGGGGLASKHKPAGADEGNNFESLSATDAPSDVPIDTAYELPTAAPTDAPTTGISCDGSSYLYYFYFISEYGGGGLASKHKPAAGGDEGSNFESRSATDAPSDVRTDTAYELPAAVPTDAPTTGISCDGSLYLYYFYFISEYGGGGGLASKHKPAAGGDEGNNFESRSATDAPSDVPIDTAYELRTAAPTDTPTTGISCDGSYLYYYFANEHGGGGLANNHQSAGGDEGNNFEPPSATDAPLGVPTNTPNELRTAAPTDAPTTGISCDGSYLYYYFANEHGGGGLANNHQPAGGDEGNNFEPPSATDAPPDVPTNTPNEVPTAVSTDIGNVFLPLALSSAAATKFFSRSTFKNALFMVALVSVYCPVTATYNEYGSPTKQPTYAPTILAVDQNTKYAQGSGNDIKDTHLGCGPLTERLSGVLTEKGEHVCKYYACPLDQYSPSNKSMCSNPYGEEKNQCPFSTEDITKYDTSTLNEYDPGCTACEVGRYRRPKSAVVTSEGECLSCPKGYAVSHAITRTHAQRMLELTIDLFSDVQQLDDDKGAPFTRS
jgi:hypothetical protein